MNPSTPPKGSLEELFRHHLLESEAAAVSPSAQVWEQVDNRLLLAQNEKYRRRLVAYRWAMAASLLLASLAGGGWWRSQQGTAPTGTLAQATSQPGGPAVGLPTQGTGTGTGSGPAAAPLSPAAAVATATRSIFPTNSPAIDQTATLSASAHQFNALALATQRSGKQRSVGQRAAHPYALASPGGSTVGFGTRLATTLGQSPMAATAGQSTEEASAWATTNAATQPADQRAAGLLPATVSSPTATMALATASTPAAEATLAMRQASLASLSQASLPSSLTEVAVAPGPPLELARRWQYGLAYSASAYQPNIDWTKPATSYSSALGYNSASLTRSAAAEYRDNLRPGLGQRLSLWASHRLGNGRWTLRTGLEVAQNTASSASSVAFVGEQVADLSYTQAGLAYTPAGPHRLQRTTYRYRSVSVPAELRYANPQKTGFSFYGRVGAFVSALLNVRSEVEGTPEAGRTYTLQSASTPYRPYSAGLRGGGGVQYRPAGHQWSLNFGPVAEMGILSLNADPIQDFWGQQRPYSFGLEAGMELGRGFRIQ